MAGSGKKTFVTMKEFMELAIQFEKESSAFYTEMKGLVADRAVVDLMAKLASQEQDHAKTLSAYSAPAGDETTLQFGPDLSISMPAPPDDPTLSNMLAVAIERENKTAQIYHAAASRSAGEFRDMIEALAGFEEEHEDRLKRLQAAYSSDKSDEADGAARGVSQPIYTKLARPESTAGGADQPTETP
jgi:rubrerythrin